MKISNKLFNEQQLGQFSKNMEKIQKIQDKISSGKNIIFASDDPVGAVQLSGMKDNLSRVGRFIENVWPSCALTFLDKVVISSNDVAPL